MFNPKKQIKMKKLTLLATMFAALTFASCGGGKEGEGDGTDSTAVTEDSVAVEDVVEDVVEDTTAVDTAAAE